MRRPLLSCCAVLAALAWSATCHAADPKVALALSPSPATLARGAAGGSVELTVAASVAPGWHINAHQPTEKFLVPTTLTLSLPDGVSATPVTYPAPKTQRFAFAGDLQLQVYSGTVPLTATVTVPAGFAAATLPIEAVLRFQACDDTTCAPPTSVKASISVPVRDGQAAAPAAGAVGGIGALLRGGAGGTDGASLLAQFAARYGIGLTLAMVALLGLGLNLTPCVYPLISVTLAYFGAQARSRGRVTWLAALYVVGIALSFSALGVAAALSGGLFGAALQQPAVVLGIAGLMVALALSSFGLYQLQPPAALLQWAGGSATGAAGAVFMGLTMGIVAAPCVGPIVVGLLLFVGSRQEAGLGFLLFFSLAIGMGVPYIVLAVMAGSLAKLPRSGEWLMWTEHFFGCVLLCLAAYYVATLLPAPLKTWLLPATIALSGIYLGFVDRAGRALPGFPVLKGAVGVGMLALAAWLARPADTALAAIAWEPAERWTAARHDGARPVLLEFGAEWCIPCREMESTTYVHPDVVREADRFRMVKADITEENEATSALTGAYDVKGVPTVILFDPKGGETQRLVGYVGPDQMLAAMRAVPSP
ncbi:MAG: cytochrome c biogenesis protein CcdA [Deltaproteobacteria bacterium]|nr:cytochrome c biogenesis protein CcdA [Deltaproteobacteria bacterium]